MHYSGVTVTLRVITQQFGRWGVILCSGCAALSQTSGHGPPLTLCPLPFAPADVRRRLRAYADEIFPLANDAVEFVTMLLLNKHYVEHAHVPTLHGQRKELMHLVNHFYPEDDFASVMAKAHKKTNVIHSVFMGREHPLFRGGVVTKAVGVCVDGCQYQPRVQERAGEERRGEESRAEQIRA